jgi:hypothetical protein
MSVGEKLKFHEKDIDSFGVVEEAVKAGQAEGVLDPDLNSGAISLRAWAEVHGLALLRNEGMIAGMSEQRGMSESQALDMIFSVMRRNFETRG